MKTSLIYPFLIFILIILTSFYIIFNNIKCFC
nr:MAG TPA: hypothetical protein [Caudoviricetes sp.]